jgi:hypothetical protein
MILFLIMTSKPISTAYFINRSHQSVCLYMYPHIVARKRLDKNLTATTNTRNNRRVVDALFSMWSVSYQRRVHSLCIPLSFLGENSVKTFSRQRKIVVGVVSYVAHVSTETRRLVLPRPTFLILKKRKVGGCDHHAVCVSVYLCIPLWTFECLDQSLWNFVCISWHLIPSPRRTS